jgi:hypothetical protein
MKDVPSESDPRRFRVNVEDIDDPLARADMERIIEALLELAQNEFPNVDPLVLAERLRVLPEPDRQMVIDHARGLSFEELFPGGAHHAKLIVEHAHAVLRGELGDES